MEDKTQGFLSTALDLAYPARNLWVRPSHYKGGYFSSPHSWTSGHRSNSCGHGVLVPLQRTSLTLTECERAPQDFTSRAGSLALSICAWDKEFPNEVNTQQCTEAAALQT